MKRLIAVLVVVAMLLVTGLSLAATDILSAKIVGTRVYEARSEMQVRLMVNTSQDMLYSSIRQEDLRFTINDEDMPIKGSLVQGPGVGYVFVVDCAKYYSQRFNFEHVQTVLNAAINGMGAQDRCAFVVVTDSVLTNGYVDKDSALSFVKSLAQNKDANKGVLYDGISEAINIASISSEDVPSQKVIAVISDAIDVNSTTTIDQLQQRLYQAADVPLINIVMYRSKFYSDNKATRENIGVSLNNLTNLSSGKNGFYRIVDHDEKDAQSIASSAGRNISSFGKSIVMITLDITAVSHMRSSDNQFALTLYYVGGGQTLADTSYVTIYASQVPTPAPTATPYVEPNPIKFGKDADSAQVRYVQFKLQQLHYFTGEISGVYDSETQRAMDEFYVTNGMPIVDGMSVAGYDLLETGSAIAKATPTPVPRDPNQKFAMGDTGPDVRDGQYLLELLGFYQGVDASDTFGTFDEKMQLATDNFCRVNNIPTADGMSLKCWNLLNTTDAKPAATASPTPGPTRDANLKLALGDQNADVRDVQDKLEKLYYYTPNTDNTNYGLFDNVLLKAVDDFCRDNKIATMDGMSVAAFNLLMNGVTTPKPTPEPVAEYVVFKPGDSNGYVNEYQILLKSLNYFDGDFTPGLYDDATQAAQDRLCAVNEMATEVGASIALQKMVESPTIKANTDSTFMERTRKFMLGQANMLGFQLPMWAVVLACALLTALVIIAIVLLLMPARRKKNITISHDDQSPKGGEIELSLSSDDPTQIISEVGAFGMDPPTSINVGGWHIALMIDYAGVSSDSSYTMEENLPLIIGRGSDADIHLNKDDLITSRRHGQFVYRSDVLYYRDNSKFGTYVDGNQIFNSECALHPGSTLEIGKHRIKIEMK